MTFNTSPGEARPAPISRFYTDGAWIEAAAEDQCARVAGLDSVRAVAAFPDLHPGKYGPVGCAILSETVFPQFVGADIGCGMTLFQLDMSPRKLKLDKAAARLRALQEPWEGDGAAALEAAGLPTDLAPEALGTIGGGNHFCEVQRLTDAAPEAGLSPDALYLLVHSGSRGLGYGVFTDVDSLPQDGWETSSEQAAAYLARHDLCVRWAVLNRQIIAARAAGALRSDLRQICDAPHNQATLTPNGVLHRKGAAAAEGDLVPLAGSRDAPSYGLKPTGGDPAALASLAHGAGRKYDRASMRGRAGRTKSDLLRLGRNRAGGEVICDDKQLMIEEAPNAYKSVDRVRDDLSAFGLANAVASFAPLITFKKAAAPRPAKPNWRRGHD